MREFAKRWGPYRLGVFLVAASLAWSRPAPAISLLGPLAHCVRALAYLFEVPETRVPTLWGSGLAPELVRQLKELGRADGTVPLPASLRSPTVQARVGHYLRFGDHYESAWQAVRETAPAELARFRARSGRQRDAELRRLSDEVSALVREKTGIEHVGYHRNMHGGHPFEYVAGSGIRATEGDFLSANSFVFGPGNIPVTAAASAPTGPTPRVVFYYDGKHASLADVLEGIAYSGNHTVTPHALILFDLAAARSRPDVRAYRNEAAPALEIKGPRANGVELEDFATYPLPVMTNLRDRVGGDEKLFQRERVYLQLLVLRRFFQTIDSRDLRPGRS